MGSRLTALVVLGLACVVAAGGGAYLAVRHARPDSIQTDVTQPIGGARQPARTASESEQPATTPGIVTPRTPTADVELPPASESTSTVARNSLSNHSVASPSSRPKAEAGTSKKRTAQEPSPSAPAPLSQDANAAKSGTQVSGDAASQQPATPQPVTEPPVERQPEFVELTVPSESVLGLQVQTSVNSETARVEDRVDARVTRDVRIGDRVAIPSGSQVIGSVVQVERGGKVRDRASLAIRFHTLILPDGSRTSLTTEALRREGPSPAGKSAAKIGGATMGGAILGAILGGGKGAAIGGGIGAAGGTAATMAGQREPATLPAGTIVNIRLMSPVSVTLER